MADEIECKEYVFTWEIQNFLSCRREYAERVESPCFIIPSLPRARWGMCIYTKGTGNINNSHNKISILFVRNGSNEPAPETLDVLIELIDTNHRILLSEEFKNCEMNKNGIYCSLCFLNYEEFCEIIKTLPEDTLTIRCVITMHDVEKKNKTLLCDVTGSKAVTVNDVNRYIFKWDVSNSLNWSTVLSIPFSTMPDLKITLSAPNETIDIKIQAINESSLPKSIVFRMIFLSFFGVKLASKYEVHSFDSLDLWQFPTFITKRDLCSGNTSPACYEYTFICECNVSLNSKSSKSYSINSCVKNEITMQAQASFPSSLREDFRKLFMNKKYSDVKLKVGQKEFFAHKAVLGTRSPVFSTMFDQNMLENQTGVVHIEDIEEDTVQNLLGYIYTDKLDDMDCERALRLLLAANKYEVASLKDRCIHVIISKLTVENVCEVVAVADLIEHEGLKSFSLNYIYKNASRVLSSPIWSDCIGKNMKLATEIMGKLSEYIKSARK